MKAGDTFEHARWIIGSPKAGTARPDVCTITKVALGTIWYRNESGMLHAIDADRLPTIVKEKAA